MHVVNEVQYQTHSLAFCFLSFTVFWFRMRVLSASAVNSDWFYLSLQKIMEDKNYFLLVSDKLLKCHVNVKCFCFNVPPQLCVLYIRKCSYSVLQHGMAVYKCVQSDSSFPHHDHAVFNDIVFLCNSTIFYYDIIVIIIPILC